MNNPRILIVEDEPIIAQDIADMLLEMNLGVFGKANSAIKALKLIEGEQKPDLAILDISIKGDLDGIGLAQILKQNFQIPFIFLTSFADEATIARAIPTEPVAYLLKPFDFNDLHINIQLALFKKENKNMLQKSTEAFFVKHKQKLERIEPAHILWAEASDNYTYLYTESEKYLISKTLKEIEEKLPSKDFVRLHRSYLVNLSKITSITEDYAFIEQHKIPLGKQYKQNLLSIITVF